MITCKAIFWGARGSVLPKPVILRILDNVFKDEEGWRIFGNLGKRMGAVRLARRVRCAKGSKVLFAGFYRKTREYSFVIRTPSW